MGRNWKTFEQSYFSPIGSQHDSIVTDLIRESWRRKRGHRKCAVGRYCTNRNRLYLGY